MEDMADVNMMFELLKGGDEISAIEKLLNEFGLSDQKVAARVLHELRYQNPVSLS